MSCLSNGPIPSLYSALSDLPRLAKNTEINVTSINPSKDFFTATDFEINPAKFYRVRRTQPNSAQFNTPQHTPIHPHLSQLTSTHPIPPIQSKSTQSNSIQYQKAPALSTDRGLQLISSPTSTSLFQVYFASLCCRDRKATSGSAAPGTRVSQCPHATLLLS